MADCGWIKLHRKIKDNWLWTEKRKFSKFEAWTDLILSANHEDAKIVLNGKLVDVKRGQFITSEVKLADKWGWDRKTVRKFLSILEIEKMCLKNSTTEWTALTIANYEEYQSEGTAKRATQGTSRGQGRDSAVDTNKNDKNDKNDKKNNIYSSEFEKFWNEYPRKTEKKKAFKAWLARINNKTSHDDMIQAAKNYALGCTVKKTETQFIKHPATFIGPNEPFKEYINLPPPPIAREPTDDEKTMARIMAEMETENDPSTKH